MQSPLACLGHQRRGSGAGGVDGDSRGDRGGAVATSGAGEGDRWIHRRSSSGGWWANRGEVGVCVVGRTAGGFPDRDRRPALDERSEEHTSELQSLMRSSYAVFCLKKKNCRLT